MSIPITPTPSPNTSRSSSYYAPRHPSPAHFSDSGDSSVTLQEKTTDTATIVANDNEDPEVAPPGDPEKRNWFQRRMDNFKPAEGEVKHMQPQLSSFSLQMIAIGGSIGTGLFIGSGEALAQGGAAGLLICYTLVSFMVYFMMQCLSELAVTFPVPGAFSHYSVRFIDASWGFAIGWNYFMQWFILLPLELSAASMTFRFWDVGIPEGWLITIFFAIIIAINMMPVKIYGYAEVVFSMSKVIAILGFIVMGLVLIFGGVKGVDAVLGKYWKNPGPFTQAGFKGILAVFVTASFSFSGTEMCGLCAAETPNPRKTIPKASRQVFWRILFFYITTLTIVGFLVPYNSPRLQARDGNVNSSPLVIALEISQIKWLPSVMNVVILISILSVGNSAIYAASRTLVSLADAGSAPKCFGYLDRKGRPLFAILLTLGFGCISYVSLIGDSAHTMFTWLLSLSGLSSLFTWLSICLSLILFRRGMKAQHRSIKELGYISNTGLFGAWFGFVFCLLVLIAQIWIAISPPSNKEAGFLYFLKICLGGIVVLAFYAGHKIYLKATTGSWQVGYAPDEIDLVTGRKEVDIVEQGKEYEQEREVIRQRPWYYRFYKVWC